MGVKVLTFSIQTIIGVIMGELTILPVKRIIEHAGAKRVSKDAAKALAGITEKKAKEVAELANKYAQHAGRITVLREDVKAAAKALGL